MGYSPLCQASMLSSNIALPNASGPVSGSTLGFDVQIPALFTSLETKHTVSLCSTVQLGWHKVNRGWVEG